MTDVIRDALVQARSALQTALSDTAADLEKPERRSVIERKIALITQALSTLASEEVREDVEWLLEYARDLRELDGYCRVADHMEDIASRLSLRPGMKEVLAKNCYVMSENHLTGVRLIIGFNSLADAQDAHVAVSRLPSIPSDQKKG